MNPEETADGNPVPAKKTGLLIPSLFAAVAILVPGYLVIMSVAAAFGKVSDLPQYYSAGWMFINQQGGQVYDMEKLFAVQKQLFPMLDPERIGIGLFLPPLAVPMLVPVALMPVSLAPFMWLSVLTACVAASLFVLSKYFKLSTVQVIWMVALVSLSGACYDSLRIGQLSPILLLSLCTTVWALRREQDVLAGLLLTAFWLKPQYIIPLGALIVGATRLPTAIFIAIGGLGLAALAVGIMGFDSFSQYIELVKAPSSLPFMQPELNPTVRGQLLRVGCPVELASGIGSIIMCASIAFALALGWKLRARSDWFERACIAVVPLMLVTALHCHEYDLLLLVPAMVALLKSDLAKHIPMPAQIAGFLMLIPLLLPIYLDVHYKYMLKGGLYNPYFFILAIYSLYISYLVWSKSGSIQPERATPERSQPE
jgi:hypothetical protein